MNIRPLRESDRNSWATLWKGYQNYYEVNLDSETDGLWQRLFAGQKDGPFCLVAELDGELVGLVQYLYHGSTWSAKERIYLHDLYTKPEVRGKGVGRALINAVYKEAEIRGCDQVYWLTQDFNTDGRRLYDKVATLTPFIKYAQKI